MATVPGSPDQAATIAEEARTASEAAAREERELTPPERAIAGVEASTPKEALTRTLAAEEQVTSGREGLQGHAQAALAALGRFVHARGEGPATRRAVGLEPLGEEALHLVGVWPGEPHPDTFASGVLVGDAQANGAVFSVRARGPSMRLTLREKTPTGWTPVTHEAWIPVDDGVAQGEQVPRRVGLAFLAALRGKLSATPRRRPVQPSAQGQIRQLALRGAQMVAPRSISAWAKSPARFSGTSRAAFCLSSALASGSGVSIP